MSIREVVFLTLKEFFQTAIISLAIFLFVYLFLVQPHRVQGLSMVPTFESGELLLTEKLSYRLYRPQRGDVIVFEAPVSRNADFIKRIIGLPGETVKIEDGSIYINGQKLEENYTSSPTQGNETVTVGSNEYFVLGDNRSASSDSRSFGTIKKRTIRGKAWLVYWPIFKSASSFGARIISSVNYHISY